MNTNVFPAELKLIDGATTITVRPRVAGYADPIMCKEWDLGAPDIRTVYNPLPGTDGTAGGAGYLGSRTVSLDLQILGGRSPDDGQVHDAYWYQQQLTAMTHPSRRPALTISRNGGLFSGQVYTMALRGNPYTIPYGRRAGAMLEMQMSFTAPAGLLEGPLQSITSRLAGAHDGDWKFPMTFPYSFGEGGSLHPFVDVAVGGGAPVAPIVYITGPCTNPSVSTDDGEWFEFTGLTLLSGQTVQIDMDAGTILVAAPDAQVAAETYSAYHLVNWTRTTFWRWLPGTHTVRYLASSGIVTVQWRDRLVSI
jgi:hypothetical protein